LKELISQLSINREEDEREIRTAAGKLIAKNDFTGTRPIISVSATFFDAGRLAGSIIVRHSIRTQIITTALTGILSSLLGCLLYFIFRTYPIRKLENTLIDLQRAQDELEQRVADRTEELMRVNEELRIDITERKLAEDDLRKSEERYRTILEDIDEGYFENDLAGNFTFVNDAECRDLGYSREELIGMNYRQYSDEATAKNLYELFHNIYNTGKPIKRFPGQFISKDGTRHFNEVSASLIRDAKGKPIGFRGVSQDITERKRAEEELRQTLDSLRKAVGTTIQVMASAVETRDPYTAGHQIRSANLARVIATEMGLSHEKIEGIRVAGSIHDIGKLSIPAEILSKPTKLSEIEFSLIKEHARKGYEMLKNVESPWPLAEIVYQHHERMDGSGYPRNLKGEEILIEARILTVADVVEAMASHRPYRPGLGIDAALNEIEKNRGIFYDKAVADACLRLFREKGIKLEGIDYNR